ncbi:TonB-dependent receptor [Bacteroidia bacterium]|nr:TonB-dependent receptor [Bacteroidia bacterium]
MDEKSNETLIGASVFESSLNKGVVSNSFGFYSLTLPRGTVEIHCSYVGYVPRVIKFDLSKDTILNVLLNESNVLQEVVITASPQEIGVKGTQMSAINVPITQIKAVPSLLGENDLIKALQLLPGVQAGTEGFTGFYVRGGGPDENLFLFDGVPLYDINHLGGFFSVFNADAVKNVTLYKGGFPARFGSRLSSVLDVRMNDGNNKKLHGNIGVGLLSAKANLEGPLFSKKTTFNISARRTYYDILAQPLLAYISSKNSDDGYKSKNSGGYYFYDLNAKISHKLSDKDRLYLSFYLGDDVIYANVTEDYPERSDTYRKTNKMKTDWNWGNFLTVFRWNRVLNNKLFMNATAHFTRYRFDLGVSNAFTSDDPQKTNYDANIKYKSGILDYSGKIEFDYTPNPNHDIKFGANYVNHTFRPGVFVAASHEGDTTPLDTVVGDKNISAHEVIGYVEDNFNIGSRIKANLGLHYSAFSVQGKFYHSLQPRVSVRTMLKENLSVKAGYTQMSQYIHLLSNNTISLPTDLWVPVTRRIEPMKSHQVALGVFYNLKNGVDLSVEGYYKTMDNIIEYKDGATFFNINTGWEDKVSMGRGWAYGLELLVQKTVGKTTGWIGYTWAKSERLFDRPGQEINFGKVFPAKYDRRHDLSLVVSHKLSDKIDFSGTWVYSTGDCATLGLQNYYSPDDYYNGDGLTYIDQRNNYRKPAYHRLDLGVNFHKKKKHGTRTWNISVYNVYNRNNPFFVYSGSKGIRLPDGTYESKKTLKQVSIFPIIPSITYIYSF